MNITQTIGPVTMKTFPRSINHIAYPTVDTAATHRFYTELLGMEFVGAIQEDEVPSTGEKTPYFHTFFALPSGECIAFFEVRGMQEPRPDGIPTWIRHLALTVASLDDLHEAAVKLRAHGVEVSDEVDHEGVWTSIYFRDPNGIRIELTHQARALDQDDALQAERLLRRWVDAS